MLCPMCKVILIICVLCAAMSDLFYLWMYSKYKREIKELNFKLHEKECRYCPISCPMQYGVECLAETGGECCLARCGMQPTLEVKNCNT